MTPEPTVSWREYVDTRFAAQKEALTIRDSERQEALKLAREIQTYKDQQGNELREQLNKERGDYARKTDLSGMNEKIDSLQKMMWIGMGVVFAFQFLIGIGLVFWGKG